MEEINVSDMKIGDLYYIVKYKNSKLRQIGTFLGCKNGDFFKFACFDNLQQVTRPNGSKVFNGLSCNGIGYRSELAFKFLIPKRDEIINNNLYKTAINRNLKQIIGDDYFKWY